MQLEGVGDVFVGGGSQPAVRVELHPQQLSSYGISMEKIKNIITGTNVNRPKGFVGNDTEKWKIEANDQAKTAKDYMPLIVHHTDGKTVRLSDVASVVDSVQDVRNMGMVDGEPCIMTPFSANRAPISLKQSTGSTTPSRFCPPRFPKRST